jgi:hypothetical protein
MRKEVRIMTTHKESRLHGRGLKRSWKNINISKPTIHPIKINTMTAGAYTRENIDGLKFNIDCDESIFVIKKFNEGWIYVTWMAIKVNLVYTIFQLRYFT